MLQHWMIRNRHTTEYATNRGSIIVVLLIATAAEIEIVTFSCRSVCVILQRSVGVGFRMAAQRVVTCTMREEGS